jgi:transcriptional regulator GlxA family with amidase domain
MPDTLSPAARTADAAPAGATPADRTTTCAFLLIEGFSMMSLSSALEPLRSANRLSGREAYRWRLVAPEAGAVCASNGIAFPVETLSQPVDLDWLFVCGGLRIQPADERRHLALLRAAARARVRVGSLSTGSWLLARAGLLDGYRCTIHWENRPAFEEQFPDLACTGKIYEIDRDRVTCSGGTAAMDLMLHLIADAHGADLALRVANQFHHERIRDGRDDQRGGRLDRLAGLSPPVRQAVALMQARIEEPLPIAEVARRVGLSPRQVERLFLRDLGMRPARYALSLRLDRARELLLYSDRTVLEVAVATGFTSTSHFAHWFKRLHGQRPTELRRGRLRAAAPVGV